MYISRSYLKGIASDSVTYYRGVDYFGERRVTILKDYLSPQGDHVVESQVRGSRMSQYYCKVLLEDKGGEVRSYACSCPSHYAYEGACKHVVATILAAESGEMENSKTDDGIRRLIDKNLNGEEPPVEPGQPLVSLEPTLEFGTFTRQVSFKLGRERMYVLKNLQQFCRDVAAGRYVEYGRQLSFYHHMEAFAPASRPLVRYLMSHVGGDRQGSSYYTPVVKTLDLSDFMLDELLELYLGRRLYLETQAELTLASVVDRNPELTLEINENRNGSFALRLAEAWQMFEGYAHCYLLRHEVLYRCTAPFTKACRDLLRLLLEKKSLMVNREDMPAFAGVLLNQVREFLRIHSNTDLEAFAPKPLLARVYFDVADEDEISAKVRFCYGETEYSIFSPPAGGACRDVRRERQAERVLRTFLPRLDYEAELLYTVDGEDGMFNLLENGLPKIAALAEIYATDRFRAVGAKAPVGVRVGVRAASELLELKVDVEGLNIRELSAVLNSYRKAKKYHRLRDGSFLSLQNSTLGELSRLAEQMDLSEKQLRSGTMLLPSYRAMALDSLMKESGTLEYERDRGFCEIVRDMHNVSEACYSLPASLEPVLRGYQKQGYQWMRTLSDYRFGGVLADDMGLGKTLQVIALLLSHKEEARQQTVSLVVCPSSLVYNWVSEIGRFAPSLRAAAVMGSAQKRRELLSGASHQDILVTSYDSLKRDSELYEGLCFQYEIVDEAQYIKNHATQSAKAVKAVSSVVRLALTGTPVENSLSELWSIFDFIMPGYLYSYTKFRKKFETPIVKGSSASALEELQEMVRPFLLRRLKREVLRELPEKTETVLYAKLEGEQERLYLANLALAQKELFREFQKHNPGQSKILVLALLTRLRQICCDPSLIYDEYSSGSAKLELCMELIQSTVESGHKLLLFSQFTSMLSRIADGLRAREISYYTITGETPSMQRLELVNRFNADDTPVFLISLKAGGTGLNLTGADVVIHYDPWWNNSAQSQATDRAYRIGQRNNVQVYRLIAKDTVEEKILAMQQSKEELAQSVIREGDGAISRMSKEEILALFRA